MNPWDLSGLKTVGLQKTALLPRRAVPLAGERVLGYLAVAPQPCLGCLGLLHRLVEIAALGKGEGIGKGVAFPHQLMVEIGAVGQVDVAQQAFVAVAVSGERIGDELDPAAADPLFCIGGGIWSIALDGRIGLVGFGCVDTDKTDDFGLAVHIYDERIAVDKLKHPVAADVGAHKLTGIHGLYPAAPPGEYAQ